METDNNQMAIVFPIHIRMKHPDDTVAVCDAVQLFDYIASLTEETNAAFVYPILMADAHENYTIVRNNAQFEKIINTNTNTNT